MVLEPDEPLSTARRAFYAGMNALTDALLVHAYDQPELVADQGTLGLELEDQLAGFDTVLVAVGGGGLIGGIATAVGDQARVVGVGKSVV